MLIQFSYNNFSSFKDDTIFSMISGKNNDKKNAFPFEKYEILPSSVIYGANASGKTSFIKAFSMMRDIALNKNKTMLSTDELPFNSFRLSTETEDASTAFDVIFEYEEKNITMVLIMTKIGFIPNTCKYTKQINRRQYLNMTMKRTMKKQI